METITNWTALWRQLVEARDAQRVGNGARGRGRGRGERGARKECGPRAAQAPKESDDWQGDKARGFDEQVKRRWSRPDSSRAFLLSQVTPDTTALDIGAGTGSWSVLLAQNVRRVTALDPSPGMLRVLGENVQAEGLDNVTIVQGAWPEAQVPPHDISLCAHAMYMTADLPHFVRRMMAVSRERCYMLMRAPLTNSVMGQAAQRVWGQPHDSPNFVVGYNVLVEMGIYAHVLMEDTGEWGAWTNNSLEEAFAEIKRKLGLEGPSEHDDFLMGLLREHLTQQGDLWVWPNSMRSALVYWDVES